MPVAEDRPVNVVMVMNPDSRPDDCGNLVSFLAEFRSSFGRPVKFVGFRSHPTVRLHQIFICEENENWLTRLPEGDPI
jgi:hypothetical protein